MRFECKIKNPYLVLKHIFIFGSILLILMF